MNIKLLIAGTLVLASFSAFMPSPAQARGVDYTQTMAMNNFATRQAQLGSQIDSALASGQLSYAQASSLHAQLNNLAGAQNQGMVQGGFSPGQMQNIVDGFTSVTTQLNQSINYNSQYSQYVQPSPFGQYNTYENNNAYPAPLPRHQHNNSWNRSHQNTQIAPHQWNH